MSDTQNATGESNDASSGDLNRQGDDPKSQQKDGNHGGPGGSHANQADQTGSGLGGSTVGGRDGDNR